MTEEEEELKGRRATDTTFVLLLSRYWHVIFGISGIILTLYSGWLTTNNNSVSIADLKSDLTQTKSRMTNVESILAVKEFQFSEIIARLNKMESKIDTLTNRR